MPYKKAENHNNVATTILKPQILRILKKPLDKKAEKHNNVATTILKPQILRMLKKPLETSKQRTITT